MEYILRIYILCITTTFSSALIISQCVGSDLILRPAEYADDQEFVVFDIRKVSEPKRSIATWPKGSVGERVKVIDEGYQNATVIIHHLQPSDAGLYEIGVVLTSSKWLTQQFTVQINKGCTTQKTETTTQQTETTTQQINTTTYLVPMPPTQTTTFSSALIISQCVGSDLILRPAEYADDQEFVVFDIRKVSEPKRSIATWPRGSVGEGVKVIDEGYQNATVIIQHLKPSDAGLYVIDVFLRSSKMLTQQFTVQINEGCITVSDQRVIVVPTNRTTTYPTTTALPTNRTTTYPTTTALPTNRTTTYPTTTALPLSKTTTNPKRSRIGQNVNSSSTSRETITTTLSYSTIPRDINKSSGIHSDGGITNVIIFLTPFVIFIVIIIGVCVIMISLFNGKFSNSNTKQDIHYVKSPSESQAETLLPDIHQVL